MSADWCYLAFVVLSSVVVMVTGAIHLLAWFPSLTHRVFYLDQSTLDDVTLGGVSFLDKVWLRWVWICLYVYQLVVHLYVISSICRPPAVGTAVRDVITLKSLLAYDLGLGSIVLWTTFRGRSDPSPDFSALTLFGASVFIWIAYSLVITGLTFNKMKLVHFRCDVMIIRAVVVNGWSALATWALLLCFYDAANSIVVNTSLPPLVLEYVWLGVATAVAVVLFLVDILCTAAYLQGTVLPFVVTLLAYLSVLFGRKDGGAADDVMRYVIYALIGLMALMSVWAVGLSACRDRLPDPDKLEDGGHVTPSAHQEQADIHEVLYTDSVSQEKKPDTEV